MSFEKLFYCFVNLLFFSELKTLKDFVRVSTHSVDQRVNLYLRLFCVKTSSNAIAFEAFDPSLPFLRFFESGLSGKRICDDAISSPGLSWFPNIGEPLMAPCKVFFNSKITIHVSLDSSEYDT